MLIRNSLISIQNINMSDLARQQAILPLAKGGLGLRPAADVALAGYLSSFKASEILVNVILPGHVTKTSNHFETAFIGI